MKLLRRVLLLFIVCIGSACSRIGFEPGGGGAIHHPPHQIDIGTPTPIELELSAVNPHGDMSHRMTAIKCHYRLAGTSEFIPIFMTTTNVDERHLIARCSLPTFPPDTKGAVEYYFDFYFDGPHYNQHHSPQDPIRVPLVPKGGVDLNLGSVLIGTRWEWHPPVVLSFHENGVCTLSPWKGGEEHTWRVISNDTIEVDSTTAKPGWERRYQIWFKDDLRNATTFLYTEKMQSFHHYGNLRRLEQ